MVREGRESVWKPGTTVERRGPVSYLVQMVGGQIQGKHIDHIQEVFDPPAVITSDNTGSSTVEFTSIVVPQEDSGNAVPHTNSSEEPISTSDVETSPIQVSEQNEFPHSSGMPDVSSVARSPNHTPVRTYPRHQHNPVDRFTYT